MIRRLRVFGRLLALHVSMTFQYRGEFVIMQLGNLIVPVTSLLVWRAALSAGADLPVDLRFLTAYFVLVSVVNMLTASWTAFFLAEAIRNGALNRWLIRPVSTHLDAVANNVGEKVIKLVLIAPFIAVLAAVFHGQLVLPTDPRRWIAFVASVVVASAIRLTVDTIIGSLAFWFEDVQGFIRAFAVIIPILSGAVVPLALMPPGLSVVTRLQPFPVHAVLPDGGPPRWTSPVAWPQASASSWAGW